MDEVHRAADNLFVEVDHLDRILDSDEPHIDLALAVAKRVRRQSTLLVKALAAERDTTATAPGGTSE